jgi:AcrR family transcriptional regulator
MAVKTHPPAPARPRQPRSLATERKLMAAVLALLDEGGLAACTAPAIAQHAGVAVGTIYARYLDKDALIAAAILDLVSLTDAESEDRFSGWAARSGGLASFLGEVARAALETSRDHRTFLVAIREFARKHPDEAWRDRFTAQQGQARALIADGAVRRFGDIVRGGEAGIRMALLAIYGSIEVAWLEPAAGLFLTSPEPEAFIASLVEMQMRYLT